MKTKKFLSIKIYIVLVIIIFTGICRFNYGFFVEKEGMHSDEEWSFGLSNSYYEPYIYSTDNRIYTKNCDKWTSGKVIKNYLTVQEGERFSFKSVYYNLSCDMHPPLYFFVLHFLSSFFVDQYIPALGFFINIICYIVMTIYIYKLLYIMTKSKLFGLLGAFFNTFNVGTLSMVVFLRMYTMLAMFAVMLVFYNACIYYDSICRDNISTYIKIFVVSCLGALTHHFFLPFAFIVTVVMSICFTIKRRWIVLGKYVGCMILGIGLSIAIFPATLDHMWGIHTYSYSDQEKYETEEAVADNNLSAIWEWTQDTNNDSFFSTKDIKNYHAIIYKYYYLKCFQFIFSDIVGFSIVSPYNRGIMPYVVIAIVLSLILFGLVAFIFRNEKIYSDIKQKIVVKFNKFKIYNFNWFLLALIVSILFIVAVCSYSVNVIHVSVYTTRYLFIIYPIVAVVICYIIVVFLQMIIKRKNLLRFVCVFCVTFILCLDIHRMENNCPYLFKNYINANVINDLTENANVVIVSPRCWLLTVYAPMIRNCNEYIYTSNNSFFKNKDIFKKLNKDKKIYFILDTSNLLSKSAKAYSDNSSAVNKYDEINPAEVIRDRNLLNNADTTEYYKENYMNYIMSFDLFSGYKYITSGENYGVNIEIYEFDFK